jgi:hypothetical protein
MNREELVSKLREGAVTVTFRKINGEVRVMHCTLKEEFLPVLKGSNHKRSPEVLPVWDLDKKAWRSFRLDSIIEVN